MTLQDDVPAFGVSAQDRAVLTLGLELAAEEDDDHLVS